MSNKLELISFKLCPFVQRAVITLNKKNVEFDITYINLMDPPAWFKKISPLGKVPVLKVAEEVLFESSVIQEYVDEISLPSLHPTDILLKAKNRAWIAFAGELNELMFKMTQAKDEESFNKAYKPMLTKLSQLENVHSGSKFFNDESFALIDASYAPMFMRINVLKQLCDIEYLNNTPKIQAWSNNLLTMDCVKTSVVPEFIDIFTAMLGNVNGYLASKIK